MRFLEGGGERGLGDSCLFTDTSKYQAEGVGDDGCDVDDDYDDDDYDEDDDDDDDEKKSVECDDANDEVNAAGRFARKGSLPTRALVSYPGSGNTWIRFNIENPVLSYYRCCMLS